MVDRAYDALLKNEGLCNAILVNCLLHAVIKEYRFDLVYKVYIEIQRSGASLVASSKRLIHGLSLGGRLKEADLLLRQMGSIGCCPDAAAYNTMIRMLIEGRQFGRAYELLQDMMDHHLTPDDVTFNSVIESLSHAKDWDKVWTVAVDMQKQGCAFYPSTYCTTLWGLLDDGKVEKAFRWLEIGSSHGLFGDALISNALVKGLSDTEKAEEAYVLLNQMKEKGHRPDASTYAALLKCLCNSKKSTRFHEVLQGIEKLDCSQDSNVPAHQN